jgi:Branched-chain amino acid transport system / permease component
MSSIAQSTIVVRPRRIGATAAILLVGAVALVSGFALPLILPSKIAMSLFAQALFDALLATSVGFLFLQNGRISFGQAAFSGLGGYAFGILVARGLVGSEIALLIALLLPTLVAFLLGLVIARVSGVAHAMLTLAVGQAFYEVAFRWRELAKGDDGMSFDLPARMFGLSSHGLQDPAFMVVLAWSILVVVLVALALFARSRIGMVTAAIRDNEERARFSATRRRCRARWFMRLPPSSPRSPASCRRATTAISRRKCSIGPCPDTRSSWRSWAARSSLSAPRSVRSPCSTSRIWPGRSRSTGRRSSAARSFSLR